MQRKRYYKIPQLSRESGFPVRTLYSAAERGELEVVRLGGAIYVPIDVAEEFIRKLSPKEEAKEAAAS